MVHISKGISKLGGAALSVGLLPVETCRPDAPCFKECYARKGRYKMSLVHKNLVDNTKAWKRSHKKFKQDIIDACLTCKYFRWFHAGDIYDRNFLKMMFEVAEAVPDTHFLAFTKKYELVNKYLKRHAKPKNLNIVLSAWGDEFIPDNPHNLPVAYVRLKQRKCTIPQSAKPCNGACFNCIKTDGGCWTLQLGESVVFNEH